MKLRAMALAGVMSAAGLGLVGAGAHAVFTQNTVSSQTITAGTLSVVLSSTVPSTTGNGTSTITLPAIGPTGVGSSFTTGDEPVTIKNNGNITATEVLETISNGTASNTFATEAYVCVVDPFGYVDYNGPLSGVTPLPYNSGLPAGQSITYTVNVYAGSETTACGAVTAVGHSAVAGTSTAPSLTNAAMGQSIDPTVTITFNG